MFEGYEMLKGLRGVTTHEQSRVAAYLRQYEDIPQLAEKSGGDAGSNWYCPWLSDSWSRYLHLGQKTSTKPSAI